ncbi:MAG: 4a-hydroxytetrahydrobiopterin dehydratase [Bacillota bacterium]
MAALSKEEISAKLKDFTGWDYKDNMIYREFDTGSFVNAVSFLVKIAAEAEKMDHHPDICIHAYSKLIVMLTTHSEGGVTEKDFNLAKTVNLIES